MWELPAPELSSFPSTLVGRRGPWRWSLAPSSSSEAAEWGFFLIRHSHQLPGWVILLPVPHPAPQHILEGCPLQRNPGPLSTPQELLCPDKIRENSNRGAWSVQGASVLIDSLLSSKSPGLWTQVFPHFCYSGHSIEKLIKSSPWACAQPWNNPPCLQFAEHCIYLDWKSGGLTLFLAPPQVNVWRCVGLSPAWELSFFTCGMRGLEFVTSKNSVR